MVADCCKRKLDLNNAELSDEYYYQSLPLCVIDSVFSIGINYNTTRKVVISFCNKHETPRLREHRSGYPDKNHQLSVSEFLRLYDRKNIDDITDNYYRNKCRTSTRNGILKSEAVKLFCEVLTSHGVNYFQDLQKVVGDKDFEQDIKAIPGQKSGISTSYFYMLSGDNDFIKPDRMIIRFVESCTGQSALSIEEVTKQIMDAHTQLKKEFPSLTPRSLDHEIWKYQRDS